MWWSCSWSPFPVAGGKRGRLHQVGFRVRTSKRPRGLSPFKELSLCTLSRTPVKSFSHLSPQAGSLILQSLYLPVLKTMEDQLPWVLGMPTL